MPSVSHTPHAADRRPTVAVTVMTFNVYNDSSSPPGDGAIGGWMARRSLVAETIREHAPDVVGLQEVCLWQLDYLLGELPEYACVGRARDAEGVDEAVPIMYRRERFDLVESGHFWLSESPHTPGSRGGAAWGNMSSPRMVTWVRLRDAASGACFYVYNTHLASDEDGGEASRAMSARLIAERIATRTVPTEYFFVVGDFNAAEDQFPLRYLTGQATCSGPGCPRPPQLAPCRATDVWRARHAGQGGTRCSNDEGADAGQRFDYILVWDPAPRDGAAATGARPVAPPTITSATLVQHGPTCASDHRALTATVEIPVPEELLAPAGRAAEAAD